VGTANPNYLNLLAKPFYQHVVLIEQAIATFKLSRLLYDATFKRTVWKCFVIKTSTALFLNLDL
jgi:hypothetical protein